MILTPWKNTGARLFCLSAMLWSLAYSSPPGADEPWPCSADGLVPDQNWVWGRLDNGLRYVVRKNALPAGHVSLRFGVEVGFANETKKERGFSHFVEHMAFNGTTHFPDETLVPELRRHGIDIGPELSAFTFLNYTIYNLDAPSVAPVDLDRWFTVIRDFADGMKFDPRQIKRERGVIASELRDRQSGGLRADAARRFALYPLSPLNNKSDGDVEKGTQKSLTEFYDKWYTPDRMIVVALGDVEPAQLEQLIQSHFNSLQARGPRPKPFDPGVIENPPVGSATVQHDPKVNGLSVEVTSVLPYDRKDNLATRRRWFARNLLLYMLNVRLQQIVRHNPERLLGLQATSLVATPYSIETSISFSAPSAEWKFGMTTLEQELRRSFEFIFNSDEIAEAREFVRVQLEQQVKTRSTASSSLLASEVFQQSVWRTIASSPESELRLANEWLGQIDAREMNREWRSLWQERRAQIIGYGYFPVPKGNVLLDEAFKWSGKQAIEAPARQKELAFSYTNFGPPGKVVRHDYLPELDAHLIEFENGVRANLKRTPFESSTVCFSARFGRGMLTQPPGKIGLGAVVSGSFLNGGLGRHAPEELRRIMSSSSLAMDFRCEEDCFTMNGQAATASLDRLCRVASAYLSDPGWSPESFAMATTQLGVYFSDLNYTPEGVIGLNWLRVFSGDDQRYTTPSPTDIKSRTLAEAREWLDPLLRSAPLEVGLVGDFDMDQAVDFLTRTIGSLPRRDAPTEEKAPPVQLSKQVPNHQFKFGGEANRAGIEVVWPVENCQDVKFTRQVEFVQAIFGDRLIQKVREDLGAAYTPSVNFWKSEGSPHDGYLTAYVTIKPGQEKRIAQLMVELADNLARNGASVDEFAQARAPIVARAAEQLKENGYWITHVIPRIQASPEVRQWPLTRRSDLENTNRDEVNAIARQVLASSHATVFLALPQR